MNRIILILCLLFFTGKVLAQRYTFLQYSTAEGLPQSQVTSIAQDERGFLWVGTLGGLARFNGRDFVTYTTENGLLNNRITFLTIIDDDLWIGHEGGVSVMNAKGFRNWKLTGDKSLVKVSDIIKFNGSIIVSTNGEGLFNLSEKGFAPVLLPGDDAQRIRDLELVSGQLYAATRGGLLRSSSSALKTWTTILPDLNISSVKRRAGRLYITSFQDGLYEFDPVRERLDRLGEKDSISTLRFCYFDASGRMWLNTNAGIWRMKDRVIDLKLSEENGLPMEAIQAVFEDRNGNVWFGTEGKGLVRFTGESFVYYNENSGLRSELIMNVDQDRTGTYWFGTYDKGIMRLDRKGNFSVIDLDNETVWCSIMDVEGSNWFGTSSGLFRVRDTKVEDKYFWEQGTPGDKITALFRLNASSFYAGGTDGVSLWKNGKFNRLKCDDIQTVRSFCSVNGQVYLVSDKGLYVIQKNKVEPVRTFSKAVALQNDAYGRLWVGTEEGLYFLLNGKFQQVPFTSDPAGNFINFLNTNRNILYVGTNNGIFEVDVSSSPFKVNRYGIGEGVVNLETNLNSSFVDGNGHVWFGTATGLVCFRPERDPGLMAPPSLVLNKVLINYSDADYARYAESVDDYGMPSGLSLPFNRNNISFELDAISLSNYPGLKFQYKLDGLQSDWSPISSNNSITFSSLPAGTYLFRARCVDARGRISSEVIIPFVVLEAFYKTWWFVLMCALVAAGAVWIMLRQRIKREREANEKERLEYRSRLLTLEQRSLNASMNRHFIFNSLNSIQYFINTQDKLSANKFLTNFAKLIRRNLDSSEEGNMVTLGQELERLDLYLSLERMRFTDKFDYSIECDPEIDRDNVVIPAMILQPFVENSIIHGILPNEGVKGIILVRIGVKSNVLEIDIRDNGIGIEKSRKSKAETDGDHTSKGMEITSKRIELLNKLSNIHFEIIGPFQIEDEHRSIKGTGVTLKMEVENLED